MLTATFKKMEFVGYDEIAYGKFIAKNAKAIQKTAKRYGTELTDEQARASAESMAKMYRHHFRAYK